MVPPRTNKIKDIYQLIASNEDDVESNSAKIQKEELLSDIVRKKDDVESNSAKIQKEALLSDIVRKNTVGQLLQFHARQNWERYDYCNITNKCSTDNLLVSLERAIFKNPNKESFKYAVNDLRKALEKQEMSNSEKIRMISMLFEILKLEGMHAIEEKDEDEGKGKDKLSNFQNNADAFGKMLSEIISNDSCNKEIRLYACLISTPFINADRYNITYKVLSAISEIKDKSITVVYSKEAYNNILRNSGIPDLQNDNKQDEQRQDPNISEKEFSKLQICDSNDNLSESLLSETNEIRNAYHSLINQLIEGMIEGIKDTIKGKSSKKINEQKALAFVKYVLQIIPTSEFKSFDHWLQVMIIDCTLSIILYLMPEVKMSKTGNKESEFNKLLGCLFALNAINSLEKVRDDKSHIEKIKEISKKFDSMDAEIKQEFIAYIEAKQITENVNSAFSSIGIDIYKDNTIDKDAQSEQGSQISMDDDEHKLNSDDIGSQFDLENASDVSDFDLEDRFEDDGFETYNLLDEEGLEDDGQLDSLLDQFDLSDQFNEKMKKGKSSDILGTTDAEELYYDASKLNALLDDKRNSNNKYQITFLDNEDGSDDISPVNSVDKKSNNLQEQQSEDDVYEAQMAEWDDDIDDITDHMYVEYDDILNKIDKVKNSIDLDKERHESSDILGTTDAEELYYDASKLNALLDDKRNSNNKYYQITFLDNEDGMYAAQMGERDDDITDHMYVEYDDILNKIDKVKNSIDLDKERHESSDILGTTDAEELYYDASKLNALLDDGAQMGEWDECGEWDDDITGHMYIEDSDCEYDDILNKIDRIKNSIDLDRERHESSDILGAINAEEPYYDASKLNALLDDGAHQMGEWDECGEWDDDITGHMYIEDSDCEYDDILNKIDRIKNSIDLDRERHESSDILGAINAEEPYYDASKLNALLDDNRDHLGFYQIAFVDNQDSALYSNYKLEDNESFDQQENLSKKLNLKDGDYEIVDNFYDINKKKADPISPDSVIESLDVFNTKGTNQSMAKQRRLEL